MAHVQQMTAAGPGGYTCQMCKAYVSYGTWHQCSGAQPAPATYDRTPDYRIAGALERIAKALEQLAAKDNPDGK